MKPETKRRLVVLAIAIVWARFVLRQIEWYMAKFVAVPANVTVATTLLIVGMAFWFADRVPDRDWDACRLPHVSAMTGFLAVVALVAAAVLLPGWK